MAKYTNFKLDTDADGIVLLTVDVPNQTMNVWTCLLYTSDAADE